MNILVVNGSPKGKNSITLQTVLYWQILHPEHTFEFLHAGAQIRLLEKDFAPALEKLEKAELVVFSYPVYTFVVPSQLHRFIELLKEHPDAVKGKMAAQVSTSKHFYDITAHRFIRDNCSDLGMRFVDGLSADMEDLTTAKGQKEARDFFQYLMWNLNPQGLGTVFDVPAPYDAAQSYALLRVHLRHGQHSSLG